MAVRGQGTTSWEVNEEKGRACDKKARRTVEYGKYGLGNGTLLEAGKGWEASCGILAHGRWPAWSLLLESCSLKLRWVMGLREEAARGFS